MRRRSREINVFNLSMLDVIAGAMAAFLIVMVILLPYYDKDAIDQQAVIAELRQTLAQQQAALQAAQIEADAARAQAQASAAETARQRQRADALAQQLARTFLVLYVRWDTFDDVDLHVIDPSGAEFWWNEHKTLPGRPGELSEPSSAPPTKSGRFATPRRASIGSRSSCSRSRMRASRWWSRVASFIATAATPLARSGLSVSSNAHASRPFGWMRRGG
ncbi:hypothetical protein [uncultured Thiocystis sp.]|jgi:hypothetical protein|uniref:hypothetical protein n=1 Tax=uncultured Thiocystis sp. TaxID=1202134 RepID=UPI0025DD307D|nr:hypothetical protein [uncultured Thiocystis sp.]